MVYDIVCLVNQYLKADSQYDTTMFTQLFICKIYIRPPCACRIYVLTAAFTSYCELAFSQLLVVYRTLDCYSIHSHINQWALSCLSPKSSVSVNYQNLLHFTHMQVLIDSHIGASLKLVPSQQNYR